MITKGTVGLRCSRTSGNHPNYSIIENGNNTEKSSGDLRRLVTQIPVKNHQLTLMGKTLMNNNNNNEINQRDSNRINRPEMITTLFFTVILRVTLQKEDMGKVIESPKLTQESKAWAE